jgi:superfamily II DNA or RNA helicase
MARTYCADYGDWAYERVRKKLDREAQCKGGDRRNDHPQQQSINHQHAEHNSIESCRQLSDWAWFEKFPRARSRVRDVLDCDDDVAAAVKVFVTLNGHRIILKTYVGGQFMIPTLRPYQEAILKDLREAFRSGASRVCLVSPTGSGKTVMFCAVTDGAMRRGNRCLIVAHRSEIVEQTSAALVNLGISHGVVAPGYPETPEPVQVASVSSLVRRLDRHSDYNLLVTDECHHGVTGTWRRVIDAMPRAKVLGVTATPERLDGRGLGDVFQTMIMGPTTGELIKAGHLSPFTCYAPSKPPDLSSVSTRAGDFAADQLADAMSQPVVVGSAVDAYEDICPGKRAIVFGVDRRHSIMLAERFVGRGHKAVHLDADTPREQRRRAIKALAAGEISLITNCGLISEGVDVPAVEAVVLARPTQSLGLHLQMVGRALRIAPGKEKALILDLAGNSYRHGLPDADRKWSLDGSPRKQRERNPPQPRHCEYCDAVNKPRAPTCTSCGESLLTLQERIEIEAELKRVEDLRQFEAVRTMNYRDAVDWAGSDKACLEQVAAARGYARGWVWHRMQELRA